MFEDTKLFDMEPFDRPRERIKNVGSSFLTSSELLAIVLRSGGINNSVTSLSNRLIKEFGSLENILRADYERLLAIPNLGEAKVSTLKAINEICLRIKFSKNETSSLIKEPKDVFDLMLKDLIDKDKEYLYLLSLDSRLRLISKDLISIGTVNTTLIHAREVFKKAISNSAVSIILVHNHPSNDATPSDADIEITKKLYTAGKLLGILVLDHVVIVEESYTSIKSYLKGDLSN